MKSRFLRILAATDIVVNPTHTIMGNQGKLAKRRIYFSSGDRIYCSTSNYDLSAGEPPSLKTALQHRAIQYCYKDGRALPGSSAEHTDQFILRVYTL